MVFQRVIVWVACIGSVSVTVAGCIEQPPYQNPSSPDMAEQGDLTSSDDMSAPDATMTPDATPDLDMPPDADTTPDAEPDLTPDLGPCGQTCAGDTPLCNATTQQCVACLDSPDCTDGVCDTSNNTCVQCLDDSSCAATPTTPLCDTSDNTCVGCLGNTNCPTVDASRCDDTTQACDVCVEDTDCTHLDGTPRCQAGSCVPCTPDTEEDDCVNFACNPQTFTCGTIAVNTLGSCLECQSDSECAPGRKCVPLTHKGTPYGNFCIEEKTASPCTRPYNSIANLTSLNNHQADYCVPVETFTTCQAVLDRGDQKTCTTIDEFSSDCGLSEFEQDGVCVLDKGESLCSYLCESNIECKSTEVCAPIVIEGTGMGLNSACKRP